MTNFILLSMACMKIAAQLQAIYDASRTQRNLFQNLVIETENQTVFTIFQLIWNQTDVRLLFRISRKMVYTI